MPISRLYSDVLLRIVVLKKMSVSVLLGD